MIVELILITMRDLGKTIPGGFVPAGTVNAHTIDGLPCPGDFLATFVIFAPLAMLADNPKTKSLATAVSWAYVLATLMDFIDPVNPLQSATPAATVSKTTLSKT